MPQIMQASGYDVTKVYIFSCLFEANLEIQDIRSRFKEKPAFILFVLPKGAEDVYQAVKYACDISLGVLNQCVVRIVILHFPHLYTKCPPGYYSALIRSSAPPSSI
jgi:hypothetical protein